MMECMEGIIWGVKEWRSEGVETYVGRIFRSEGVKTYVGILRLF